MMKKAMKYLSKSDNLVDLIQVVLIIAIIIVNLVNMDSVGTKPSDILQGVQDIAKNVGDDIAKVAKPFKKPSAQKPSVQKPRFPSGNLLSKSDKYIKENTAKQAVKVKELSKQVSDATTKAVNDIPPPAKPVELPGRKVFSSDGNYNTTLF